MKRCLRFASTGRRHVRVLGIIVAVLLGRLAHAAPLERDLGDGLAYFRVHHVPADLPSAEAMHRRPVVLDLRYATGDTTAAVVLRSWLEFHAGPKSLVIVLVNGGTEGPLQIVLAQRGGASGLLTIGIAGQRFAPDITVNDTSANERKSYDALEKGASIAALTTDHPEKQRNDEASLAHDVVPEAPEAGTATNVDKSAAKPGTPGIDAALQRAIHVHRGLRALKKV